MGCGYEWGRIGEQQPRGARLRECGNREEALYLAAKGFELRLRHRYTWSS
jgi:hypothetical protein